MKISPTLTLALLTIFIAAPAQAQTAALYEVPLEERIDRSELIVEGRVVDQESFWNSDRTLIFTASHVDVYRVFKGQVQGEQIRGHHSGRTRQFHGAAGRTGAAPYPRGRGRVLCRKSYRPG